MGASCPHQYFRLLGLFLLREAQRTLWNARLERIIEHECHLMSF